VTSGAGPFSLSAPSAGEENGMEPLRDPDPSPYSLADGLTDRERSVLDMERREWRSSGAKELAVRTELGLSSARYYQVLNALLDSPEALRADPMLVKRLRRIRDARVHARRIRQFRASAAGSDHE
jgi:hypothetical protein